jgi:hypothetical protein
MTIIGFSDILTAFDTHTIGSKVLDDKRRPFLEGLAAAIEAYDPTEDRVPGQHFIVCPEEMKAYVSAGDGPASNDPEDYVVRSHREGPQMFLKRHLAGEVKFLACVVYTIDAYEKDPEVDRAEVERLRSQKVTHVLVAVIASSGPAAPVTPFRFVSNLAGGNREYQCQRPRKNNASRHPEAWDTDNQSTSEVIDILSKHIEFLEEKAGEVKGYWTKWSVVAD